MSELFMEALNKEFKGQLSLAIEIFKDKYYKRFLHNLVSGQLDMDRLDYLKRDSFFTGVSEGVISMNESSRCLMFIVMNWLLNQRESIQLRSLLRSQIDVLAGISPQNSSCCRVYACKDSSMGKNTC